MLPNEEEKLKMTLAECGIDGKHIRYEGSVHSVQDLMNVSGLALEQITKTIILIGAGGETIAALVPAQFRASTSRIGKALNAEPPRVATPDEAYERTGFPVGGMPCFGYDATLIVDPKIFEQERVYTGGGSEFSVTEIRTEELKKLEPLIQRIRGKKSN